MHKERIKLEIYEGDPFEGSCCGPSRSSRESVDELREMLTKRNETLRRLEQEFRETLEVSRDIVSTRRGLTSYPAHVRKALSEKGLGSLPYIFIDEEPVSFGHFPTYEEFLTLLSSHLEKGKGGLPER